MNWEVGGKFWIILNCHESPGLVSFHYLDLTVFCSLLAFFESGVENINFNMIDKPDHIRKPNVD